MNYLSIGVIIGYMIILFYFVKDDEYLKMLGLTLLTGIIICQLKSNGIEGLTNSNLAKANSNSNANSNVSADPVEETPVKPITSGVKDTIIKTEPSMSPLDLKHKMGPYDGLCVRTLNNQFKDLSKNKLVPNDTLMSYLGVQGPVQNVSTDDAYLSGPTVDGEEDSPQRLFMFANNAASPSCCPSTFSTSTGCICSTEKQDDYIRRRGFNNDNNNVV
jgi:hypothetical protein